MRITEKRRQLLIEAMETTIASYNHKKKIAKDFSKIASKDFCQECQNKIEIFYDMIKILKKE